MRRGEWLTGRQLMGRWKMQDFELLEFVKHGLKPYSPTYKRPFEVPPFDPVFDPIIHDLFKPQPEQFNPNIDLKLNHIGSLLPHLSVCLFRREDVEEFEKKSRLESATKGKEKLRPEQVFPCTPGTKWEDITMTLTANDMVRIKTPQGEGQFTYHELKMKDIRKGDQPTLLWELLRLFAKENGFISSQNVKYDSRLPDTAKRLNYHLKNLFGIDESIYTGHYKREKGYRTRIKFYDRTF